MYLSHEAKMLGYDDNFTDMGLNAAITWPTKPNIGGLLTGLINTDRIKNNTDYNPLWDTVDTLN